MSERLQRVALITGGGGALGRGIAARLQKAGLRIALADLNAAACEEAAKELSGDAFAVQMDVTSAASVEAGVALVLGRCGGIDVLVTNRPVDVGVAPVQVFRTARGQRVIYMR